ncbi:DHHA1 domain-containing protein [Thalassotalea fusca]
MHYDVFNGDADGIIALVQLRLNDPKQSQLITGVKRDIELVKRVDVDNASSVTVLDISMEKNQAALIELLERSVPVFYADHHRAGDIPESAFLEAHIDLDANTCTSLIVNHYLSGKYAKWAVAAAYGDNMISAAEQLADELALNQFEREQLKQLGIYVNYNGYGASEEDLHFPPSELFKLLVKYQDPLLLIDDKSSVFWLLKAAYEQDMSLADGAEELKDDEVCKIISLPDQPWSRRVSGVIGNELANQSPDKAHAVITENADGSYRVSLRAPLTNKQGADKICVKFDTGGGRAAAAGINYLPANKLQCFISEVHEYYGQQV